MSLYKPLMAVIVILLTSSLVVAKENKQNINSQFNQAGQALMALSIQAASKQFGMPVLASNQYPITVILSQSNTGRSGYYQHQGAKVNYQGKFNAKVQMQMAGPSATAASSLASKIGMPVQINKPQLNITSGAIEFAGNLTINNSHFAWSSGTVSCKANNGPVKFGEGTLGFINQQKYRYQNGQWQAISD